MYTIFHWLDIVAPPWPSGAEMFILSIICCNKLHGCNLKTVQWQLSNVWDLTYELWVERDVYSAHVIQIQVWSDISRECILSDNNQ